jgi:hypothetical protein
MVISLWLEKRREGTIVVAFLSIADGCSVGRRRRAESV